MLTLAGIFCLSNQKYVILVFVDVEERSDWQFPTYVTVTVKQSSIQSPQGERLIGGPSNPPSAEICHSALNLLRDEAPNLA